MRTCCLVNHFNYGAYVGEAVASALAQTHPLDEVVVVDDGSEPEALCAAEEACAASDRARLVAKENGGQLSCFTRGLEESSAELVFFLDADDYWEPEYVERVLAVFAARPDVDFVATNDRRVFADGTTSVEPRATRDLGFSLVQCLEVGGAWVGAPTSCLAIRREVLEQVFPLPSARGWRICADEALVYGSSMAGARKYFLGEPLVNYRVHGENRFYGKEYDAPTEFWRRVEGRRLVELMRHRLSLPASLARLAHHEFATIEAPTRAEYRSYMKIVRDSDLNARHRRRVQLAIFGRYRLGRKL